MSHYMGTREDNIKNLVPSSPFPDGRTSPEMPGVGPVRAVQSVKSDSGIKTWWNPLKKYWIRLDSFFLFFLFFFSCKGFQRFVEDVSRGWKIDPHWFQQSKMMSYKPCFDCGLVSQDSLEVKTKPIRPVLNWLITSKPRKQICLCH